MRNFQDVLLQRDLEYGPPWCNEGIYRIAKELQLLNPSLFSNTFLGIRGFHMEKILISCCGNYLKECRVENVFVESDVFRPGVAQSVMSGSNYIRGKKGMMILAEILQQLQFQQYNQKHPISEVDYDNIKYFQSILSNTSPKESHNWGLHENNMRKLINQYETFTKDSREKSAQFFGMFFFF